MKYKIGDKVRIKSREWYEQNKDENGDVCDMNVAFSGEMSWFCGKIMIINSIDDGVYRMEEDDGCWAWSDEMIEGLAEEKPLDLTEILKDCPKGTKLWSPLFGKVEFEEIEENRDHPIKVVVEKSDLYASFSEKGCYYADYEDAECVLFPSKEHRDWSKFKAPRPDLAIDTPVMVKGKDNHEWLVRYYAGNGTAFMFKCKSGETEDVNHWGYIIPCDKFNFADLDANLNSEHNYGTKGDGQ